MSQVLINEFLPAKKLNRIYRLTIQDVDEYGFPKKTVSTFDSRTFPITMEFSVKRNLFAEVNSLDVSLYNLAPDTYNNLFFDYYNGLARTVVLEAGYETTGLSTIFIGDMWNCFTHRDGANVITKMHCFVGLRTMQLHTDVTMAGASRDKVLAKLASDMNYGINIYSGKDEKFTRPVSLSGNPMKLAQQYSNESAYIDNGKLIILENPDAIKGEVPLINDESGLLGVPQHENALLSVDIIFEPRMVVGQIIEVNSRIHPMFNGQYKVFGIKHEGVISGAEAGKATTTLEMMVGSQLYGRFGVVTPRHEKKPD